MLGLAQEIAGHQSRIGPIIGDDGDLGGSGQKVEAALPEELALGLGHEFVAGPTQHVGLRHPVHAKGHQGESLHSAQHEDAIGAGFLHGVDGGRVVPTIRHRGGAADDGTHPRDLGRDDAHLGGTEHGIPPTGHVASHAVDGYVLVAQDHAGTDLHLEWQHGGPLGFGELAHIALAELGVPDELLVAAGDGLVDL